MQNGRTVLTGARTNETQVSIPHTVLFLVVLHAMEIGYIYLGVNI